MEAIVTGPEAGQPLINNWNHAHGPPLSKAEEVLVGRTQSHLS